MAKINYEYLESALEKESPWGFYALSLLYPSPPKIFDSVSYLLCFKQ